MWSDQTDAAATFTFATATGLASGIVNLVVETKANEVFPEYSGGLYWKGGTANEAITTLTVAGQLGAAQTVIFTGEYWYET